MSVGTGSSSRAGRGRFAGVFYGRGGDGDIAVKGLGCTGALRCFQLWVGSATVQTRGGTGPACSACLASASRNLLEQKVLAVLAAGSCSCIRLV